MHDQADSENTIEDGIAASRRDKCCGGQWNETGREKAFEGPVVRSIGTRGCWEGCRVIHSALYDCLMCV